MGVVERPGTVARGRGRSPSARDAKPLRARHQGSPWPRCARGPCSSLSPLPSCVSRDVPLSPCQRLDDGDIAADDAPPRAAPDTHPRESPLSTAALPGAGARPARTFIAKRRALGETHAPADTPSMFSPLRLFSCAGPSGPGPKSLPPPPSSLPDSTSPRNAPSPQTSRATPASPRRLPPSHRPPLALPTNST